MMTADEYQHLRENNTQDEVIEELQKLCHEKGLLTHDLKALRESLLMNHRISRRTHLEWQPQEVQSVIYDMRNIGLMPNHKWRIF